MPDIEVISDRRNRRGAPGDASADMRDYEKAKAAIRPMNELARSRRSGEAGAWLTSDEMQIRFRAEINKK